MILDQIVEAAIVRIGKARKNISLNEMMVLAKKSSRPFAFENALKQKDISFICEVKKASPSKGIISDDFPYLKIAKEYEKAGAAAISVLTEPKFFMGSVEYLKEIKRNTAIPVLQKDFIIDEYQIYEASVIGADAILLICAILSKDKVKKFIEIADSLGLSCLVEAHNEQEVKKAIKAGARIIGVNNRDLKTFEVDINNSINLRKLVPENIIFVSESGIKTIKDINALREIGADAVLIGETFMRSNHIKAELDILRGKRSG
jgi:indole-3-glycerol phosphate synthase